MELGIVELVAGPARATIDLEAGGRLATLQVAGFDLLVGREVAGGRPLEWGAYPMAPWAGRIRDGRFSFEGQAYRLDHTLGQHPLHGTAFRHAWTVDEHTDSTCRLRTDLGPEWPFGGSAVQVVELEPNRLSLTLEVHAGDVPMPASCGWHPWWRRDLSAGGALEVEFDAGARWERDRDVLPTGEVVAVGERPARGWDDCFTDLRGPTILQWPGASEITVESDCPCLVVYDEPSHAVCVEPQTAPPDAVNIGQAALVKPGAPLIAHTTWWWVLG